MLRLSIYEFDLNSVVFTVFMYQFFLQIKNVFFKNFVSNTATKENPCSRTEIKVKSNVKIIDWLSAKDKELEIY